jgi:HD superfamily phosphodiesterase
MYELDHYIPERAWFDRQEQSAYAGTHGIGHITRVLVWSAQIADRLDAPLRRAELLWAAGLHDINRWDDWIDRGHGERAAEWVLTTFPLVRPADAARLDVSLIAALCRDHERHDELITNWSAELRVLKDADGLDRVRIGDLAPSRLRLQAISPALEPLAWTLLERSEAQGNDAAAVRLAGIDLGIWE